jgi:hypothetical protein
MTMQTTRQRNDQAIRERIRGYALSSDDPRWCIAWALLEIDKTIETVEVSGVLGDLCGEVERLRKLLVDR